MPPRPGEEQIGDFKVPAPRLLDYFSRTDNLILALLKSIAGQRASVNIGGQDIVIPAGSGNGKGRIIVDEIKIQDNLSPRVASTTHYPQQGLADCRDAVECLLVVVFSTCDQALSIQTIGGTASVVDAGSAFNIEAPQALPALSAIGLGVDLSVNWYPYMGCSIATGVVPPTAGEVKAFVFKRKWE